VEVIENGRVTEKYAVGGKGAEAGVGEKTVRDGLEVVSLVMSRYKAVPLPGLPRFTGGAVGFLGYEFIHDIEPVVPVPPKDDLGTPTLYFLLADELLIFDRAAQTITILVNALVGPEGGAGSNAAAEAYDDAVSEIDRLVSLLEQPTEQKPVVIPLEVSSIPFDSNVTREAFYDRVLKAKEYIRAGDIIQVVGSQRFSTEVKASPLDIYREVDQPLALHVFAGVGRVFPRGRVPGDSCEGRGREGGDSANRGDAASRGDAGGG
jgi:anthranilate synthase component 1